MIYLLILLIFILSVSVFAQKGEIDGISVSSDFWQVDGHGNHRLKILVEDDSEINEVYVKWRRHDKFPENKALIIEFEDGSKVEEYYPYLITNDYGKFYFTPSKGKGIYYVYYLPFKFSNGRDGEPFPDFTRELFVPSPKIKKCPYINNPKAKCISIEYRETQNHIGFNAFYPMEIIATQEEVKAIKNKYKKNDYLLYFEDAYHPIKMKDYIPYRWAKTEPATSLDITVQPNEYKVFQLGLYAFKKDIENISLKLPKNITCFNTEGVDYKGDYFTKTISVSKGQVQALWFGIDTDKNINSQIEIYSNYCENKIIPINVKIQGEPLKERGFENMWSLSRLAWLNDQTGTEDTVFPPYTEVETENNKISILDREIILNEFALPKSIKSRNIEILNKVVEFSLGDNLKSINFEELNKGKSFAEYKAEFQSDLFKGVTNTRIEFDGCVDISVKLSALNDFEFDNSLSVPLNKSIATYLMGYGHQGEYRKCDIDWHWNETQNNHKIWIGDADAGLYLDLRDTKDTFDMYYNLNFGNPPSWYNDGEGGSRVTEKGDAVYINPYTGIREFKKNDEIEFNFRFLITPFHKITNNHWDRTYIYYGANKTANYFHEHHAAAEYPFINYPLFHEDKIREVFEKSQKDFKGINLYNTIREISCHIPELWAFESLGDEIFEQEDILKGSQAENFLTMFGGECPWVKEHLNFKCHPEWVSVLDDGEIDPAIATKGLSRLANFYVKNFEYTLSKLPFDGLYVDSTNTDRRTFKRIARILEKKFGYHRINFHGYNMFNHFNTKSSPALTYMELMPFFDSLWFGEEFEYCMDPDYWMVEISGIPFGLTSEELDFGNKPNQYRGMIFGMGSRHYKNNTAVWNFWKQYKIEECKTMGYWRNPPVVTDKKDILTTCYVKNSECLISIASWSESDEKITLNIDFDRLGINKDTATLTAPYIEGFQENKTFDLNEKILINKEKGYLLILK